MSNPVAELKNCLLIIFPAAGNQADPFQADLSLRATNLDECGTYFLEKNQTCASKCDREEFETQK